jgi:flagellar hook assembly protein FlgD
MNAGTFETVWDGIDRKGQVVPSGIYIVYTKTDDFEKKRKIVVVR